MTEIQACKRCGNPPQACNCNANGCTDCWNPLDKCVCGQGSLESGEGEIHSPEHYNQLDTECIDVIEGLEFGYHIGNCLKYIWRHKTHEDGELENLKKARWFLDRYIQLLEDD